MGDNAQVHVIDALTAVSIIILTLMFAANLTPTQSAVNPNVASQLKIIANDALRSLDSEISEHNPDLTRLEYSLYLYTLNITDFETTNYLNESFPSHLAVSYNLYVFNSSESDVEKQTALWFPNATARFTYGTVVHAHRIMVDYFSHRTYDVILEVWSI